MTQRSPSIRARTHARGPQRLCSLDPDTSAAVPSLWRSRDGDPTHTVRAARVRRRRSTPRRLRGFHHRARRHHARSSTYRQSAITSLRATATIPIRRARLPVPKARAKPLRQRAVRLPAHPIPRQLNTDRLQPRIARPTDPLLARASPLLYGVGAKPRSPPIWRRFLNSRHTRPSSSNTDALVVATPFSCTSCRTALVGAAARHRPLLRARAPRSARASTARRASARASRACTSARQRRARPIAHRRVHHAAAPPPRQRGSPTSPASRASDSPAASAPASTPSARDSPGAPLRRPRVGTRTSLHTRRSPQQTRTSIRTNFSASSRSVLARRARRFTSMLAESTTRLRDPHRRQRAMNPEPIAARFVTAHHPRRAGNPNRARARRAARAPPPARSPLGHRPHPRLHAEARRHRQLPVLLRPTRTPHTTSARLHSYSGRVVAIITASFWL